MELKLKLSNYFKQKETLPSEGRREELCYGWEEVKGTLCVDSQASQKKKQRVLMCGLNQRFWESLGLHGHLGDQFCLQHLLQLTQEPCGEAMWTAEDHGQARLVQSLAAVGKEG